MWALCLENSGIKWSASHRDHHKYVDTDKDPYDATKGFWHSHIIWIVLKRSINTENVKDLKQNTLIRLQDKYYIHLNILINFITPLIAGYYLEGRLFGLFFSFFIFRLILSWHVTFFINSWAHFWGSQPYSTKHTAKDSHLLGLLAFGEGYHNFHHTFPSDYRNGFN